MLQPVPVRPFFRLLGALLGVLLLVGGSGLVFMTLTDIAVWGWQSLIFVLLGAGLGVFGILALILAATGCLPEWVIGAGPTASEDHTPAV